MGRKKWEANDEYDDDFAWSDDPDYNEDELSFEKPSRARLKAKDIRRIRNRMAERQSESWLQHDTVDWDDYDLGAADDDTFNRHFQPD